MIGGILGVAVAGELFGPRLGALADSAGTEVVFSCVALVAIALRVAAMRMPDPGRDREELGELRVTLVEPAVLRTPGSSRRPRSSSG